MRIFFSPEVALAHPGPPGPQKCKMKKNNKKIHKNRKNGKKSNFRKIPNNAIKLNFCQNFSKKMYIFGDIIANFRFSILT